MDKPLGKNGTAAITLKNLMAERQRIQSHLEASERQAEVYQEEAARYAARLIEMDAFISALKLMGATPPKES